MNVTIEIAETHHQCQTIWASKTNTKGEQKKLWGLPSPPNPHQLQRSLPEASRSAIPDSLQLGIKAYGRKRGSVFVHPTATNINVGFSSLSATGLHCRKRLFSNFKKISPPPAPPCIFGFNSFSYKFSTQHIKQSAQKQNHTL